MKINWFLFTIIFLISSACFRSNIPVIEYDQTENRKENFEALDQWFNALCEEGLFNGSVLISKEGQPLLSAAYGYIDHTHTDKLTTDYAFRLASVSKQFTAAAVMLLQQDGLLAYDDPLRKYIPKLLWDDVTIRHALTHTSGMPDYEEAARSSWKFDDPLTTEEVIRQYAMHPEPLRFEPTEKYEYSNTAYILLAKVVENISGKSFEDFTKDRIFNPLGMHRTRVWNLLSKDNSFDNKAYGFDGNKLYDYTNLDGVVGDGGIYACAEDFLQWDKCWYNHSLISEANIELAFEPATLKDGKKSYYGFGWGLSENGKQVSHTGEWVAARTFILRDLELKSMVVLLDNSTNKRLSDVWEILELFLEDGKIISEE